MNRGLVMLLLPDADHVATTSKAGGDTEENYKRNKEQYVFLRFSFVFLAFP